MPGYLLPLWNTESRFRRATGPHFDVLIDMAIADRRHNDVLHWHDAMLAGQKPRGGTSWYGSGGYADAVAESHPERSLENYRKRVNDHLPHAGVSSYEAIAGYLRKMRPTFRQHHREMRVGWFARGHSTALQEQDQVHGDSRQTRSKANCGTEESLALDWEGQDERAMEDAAILCGAFSEVGSFTVRFTYIAM